MSKYKLEDCNILCNGKVVEDFKHNVGYLHPYTVGDKGHFILADGLKIEFVITGIEEENT